MNKKQFLDKLDNGLKKIEKKEREQVLDFYNNYIDEAIDNENTEEKIVDKIGNVHLIVNKIKSEYHVHRLDEEPHILNLAKAIISILRRVPLFESIKAASLTTLQLILAFIVSLVLLVVGIGVFILGITASLIFLYSSTVLFDMASDNLLSLIVSLSIIYLIAPIIICIIILLICGVIKIGKVLFRRSKKTMEKIMVVFDWCIIVPIAVYLCVLAMKDFNGFASPAFVFLESISIIIAGITGTVIAIIMILSRLINKKISKSFNKILLKLEGERK